MPLEVIYWVKRPETGSTLMIDERWLSPQVPEGDAEREAWLRGKVARELPGWEFEGCCVRLDLYGGVA